MRHRGVRETSSAVQPVDFDGSALINFFGGSASRRTATVRVGTGSCRQCVASVVCIDSLRRHCVGGSYRRSTSALRRQCVVSRGVASAYIGADDRLTSAAQRFVDFSSTVAASSRALYHTKWFTVSKTLQASNEALKVIIIVNHLQNSIYTNVDACP